MKTMLTCLSALLLVAARSAAAQDTPNIVWEVPTPSLLANSVLAVGWSPVADSFAVGSDDRWFRLRQASDGALLYSVLEPQHSHGVAAILYSIDGGLIGVRNQSSGMSFRVQQASDGLFLGNVVGTFNANALISFAPDATLLANTGGDGTISRWRFSDLTVFRVTGTGYQTVSTAFSFSPDGTLQAATAKGRIVVQRRSDAAVVKTMRGGPKLVFSPDSSLLASWSPTPNHILLWRTSNWTLAAQLPSPASNEGVAGMRFSPDGQRLVSTGYSPYLDPSGLWQQKGFIRFWDVASGTMQWNFDQQTDIAVTSAITWSPDGLRFGYGLYNGTAAVAITPP
ncbi:MAG TPA: WD40 repeat domain-containing protein [Planctomycetota bacterium]|nr:WD40 repeat domain-containing protein [Planctomycetota bacterium]